MFLSELSLQGQELLRGEWRPWFPVCFVFSKWAMALNPGWASKACLKRKGQIVRNLRKILIFRIQEAEEEKQSNLCVVNIVHQS